MLSLLGTWLISYGIYLLLDNQDLGSFTSKSRYRNYMYMDEKIISKQAKSVINQYDSFQDTPKRVYYCLEQEIDWVRYNESIRNNLDPICFNFVTSWE